MRLGVRLFEDELEIRQWPDGALVLGCLRTFHDGADRAKSTRKAHREQAALAALYVWMCELDEAPCLPFDDLVDAFGKGRERDSMQKAAEFYADCMLKMDRWLGHDAGIYFGDEPSLAPWGMRGRAHAIANAVSWEELQEAEWAAEQSDPDWAVRPELGDGNRWVRARRGAP
jgi:hypothetical protein